MSPVRLVKFIGFWLAAWVLLAGIAVATVTYYSVQAYQQGSHEYRKRHDDMLGLPSRWTVLAVVAGAGASAFGAAVFYYLRRGGQRGIELEKEGFLIYGGPDGDVHVPWSDVARVAAGPEPDVRVVSLRIAVQGHPRMLKVLETQEGFVELKERLCEVYDTPRNWLAAASASEIVLYER